MWDLPGPEIEPVSPALAGGFLTTAPPGKSWGFCLRAKNHCPHGTDFLVLWCDFIHCLWGLGVKVLTQHCGWFKMAQVASSLPYSLLFFPSSSIQPWSYYPALQWSDPRPFSGKTQVLGATILGPPGMWWLSLRASLGLYEGSEVTEAPLPTHLPDFFSPLPGTLTVCWRANNKDTILKAGSEKRHRRLTIDFSSETVEAKRQYCNTFKALKENNYQVEVCGSTEILPK